MTVEQKLHQTNARLVELTEAVSKLNDLTIEISQLTHVLSEIRDQDKAST